MSNNPKHYRSSTPCARCNGYVRYVSTNNCVPCAKLAVKKRRAATRDSIDETPPATYEDLL